MNLSTTIFEGIMIFCWGVSWPVAVFKTLKTKTVKGVSVVFLWFVLLGYISGILFKISERMASGYFNPVLFLYIFNLVVVGTELVLYYHYRKNINSEDFTYRISRSGENE